MAWKSLLENHGLTVNLQKTKIMHCKYHDKKDTRKFPCGVYRSGVGRNSIFSTLAIQIFFASGRKGFSARNAFLDLRQHNGNLCWQKYADATLDFLNLHEENGNLHWQNSNLPGENAFSLLLSSFVV